jgi:AcrR family transcriptional regulator
MSATDPFAAPTRAFADAMAGADAVEQRPTPAAVFERARTVIRSGHRLDMAALAAHVGISRPTLYRWTGDRERLLADVSWAEVELLLRYFDGRTKRKGVAHIERLAGDFLSALANNEGLQALLANEGDSGLRVITAPTGGVRPRMVAAVREIIEREAAGGYRPPTDPQVLADGIVALGERWLYHGGDPALNPDPATAREMIGLLLRESATCAGSGGRATPGRSPGRATRG